MTDRQPTNGELAIMIKNLCKEVEEGFKGVHLRQDKTNGNVLKNTEDRLKNAKVPIIVYSMVGVILTSFLFAIMALVITR